MIKSPFVTSDCVIIAEDGEVLLIRRKNPPFQGHWALPGGFIETGQETVEECAVREAHEETNLRIEIDRLLGVWSRPGRDPRGHTVTCVYLTRPVPASRKTWARGCDDAADVMWIRPDSRALDSLPFAFDHRDIIETVFPAARKKGF